MSKKVHCRSLSSIHIRYNHTPAQALTSPPGQRSALSIFQEPEVVLTGISVVFTTFLIVFENGMVSRKVVWYATFFDSNAPAGQRFFLSSPPKISKSLKNRALRAPDMTLNPGKNRIWPLTPQKVNDPAKMTYSIPVFLSRNEDNLEWYFYQKKVVFTTFDCFGLGRFDSPETAYR